MIKQKLACLSLFFYVLVCLHGNVRAQENVSVLATDLKSPTKIILSERGSLFVGEAGDPAPNTGRISIVDRVTGERRTLIEGLPSALSPVGGGAPDGVTGLYQRGRTLYVTTALGDATLPGPAPGTEVVNPTPSSPLFSAVLKIRLSARAEETTSGFTLTLADQARLDASEQVVLTDAEGNRLFIELVADLPDYVAEPRPGLPDNVRGSHLFGLTGAGGNALYVVDAGLNAVHMVNTKTGEFEIFASFPPLPNPLPFGPPVVETVPSSIFLDGDRLLVPLFTGFPFPPGASEVRQVELASGATSTFIGNLTTAIDVLSEKMAGKGDRIFVLEFSTNMLAGAPGRLLRFDSPDAAPVVVADNLITPTSMARDRRAGEIYVTEISTGRVLKIMTD